MKRTPLEREVRRTLTGALWPEQVRDQLGLLYRGPTDFVLRHGRFYEPAGPGRLPWGAPRSCFGNAIAFGVRYDLRYIEGFAVSRADGGVLVHHAWNSDGRRAFDVTWRAPGAAYIGVEFSPERADDATWNGDASVLDDFNRGWPLLREPWNGEPPGAVWAPSDRLGLFVTDDESEAATRVAALQAEAERATWEADMSDGHVLSLWTIFERPLDAPESYVVREFRIMRGVAEPVPAAEAQCVATLEQARALVPPELSRIARYPNDDRCIVETWL